MVDEIVDRYVAGEFEGEELERVRNYFFRSEARKEQLRFAVALRERESRAADVERTATGASTVVPFEPKRRSLVPYLAIAASLIVAASIGYTLYRGFQFQTDLDHGLVALNTAYRQERPVEARLSNLDYAPFIVQRGGTPRVDYVQRDLAGTLLMKAATDTPNAASHRALGQYYLAEREIDKAIDQFNTALAIDPYDAKTHINLGAALLEKGKQETGKPLSRAVENFSRSLEHLNEGLKLDNTLLEGYFNRALVYQYMMLPHEAEAAWRDYLQRDPNSQWSEEAKRNLKRLEESNSQKSATIDDALEEFREARAAGNDDDAWKVVSQRYTSAGNELTNKLLDSFLGLASDNASSDDSLSDLSYLASLEQKRTGDRFTSDLVQRYGQTTPAVRNRIAIARRHANAAFTLFTQSKFTEAVNEYTAAKQEYEDAGDTIGRTFILYRLAHCDVFLGDLAKAQQSYQQLLSISEANGYHWLVGQCLYGLAHASADNSEYSKGIDYSSRALAKFQQFQDLNGEVKALTQLAAISQELYRDRTALDYLSQGLALTTERQIEPIQRWGVFVQIGFGMDALRLHDAALLYQKQALEIALEMGRPLMISRSRGYVGSAYAAVKMYPEAVVEATKAYEVGSSIPESGGREIMANASWKLGDILRESSQCDRAIDAYNRSIDLYRDLKIEYFSYVAHKGRLFCLANSGDNNAIGNELTTVLKLFEDYRSKITTESQRNSFFAMEQSVYDFAIDYEFQRKADPIKAFEYSEASRARTLLDAVSGSTSVLRMSYGPDLAITAGRKSLNLAEIQTRMPDAAQILQYAVVDNKLFIWVVTKSQIQPEIVNITAPALTDKVRGYLTSINQPPPDANPNTANANSSTSSVAAELFRLLVAPAEPFLDKNKFLCIVPDKILHYLPFDALVSPSTGAYLVEDYNIGVAPSSSVFVDLTKTAARKTHKGDESFLGVGNPRFDRVSFDSLNDLKSAVKEVENISNFYPQHHRLLVGPRATKDNIRSEIEKADVVHLAMHFILNGKSEMLSGFPLTPKAPATDHASDGFWQSAEIYSLKLPRTRLALLSACQTGIEQQYDAEGAVGAARPFFVAGVPVVVASLWAVDSDASAALMIDLHKHRTRDERPVTQALRLAKLDMLHGQDPRYRHPYYWAPFVVVGGLSTF
jgi:CHAT domain-containing protein/lipoprotein NlpI